MWHIIVESVRRKIGEKKKRNPGKIEAPTMAVRPALKQPWKNAQRGPGEKDGLAITVERRDISRGFTLRHLSHLRPLSSLQRTTLEKRLSSEA